MNRTKYASSSRYADVGFWQKIRCNTAKNSTANFLIDYKHVIDYDIFDKVKNAINTSSSFGNPSHIGLDLYIRFWNVI